MKTAAKAFLWILLGVAVTLFLVVDPLDVHPVDGWIWGLMHGSLGQPGNGSAPTQLYTCPMHPNIVQDRPGSCPICGMDLVPIDNGSDTSNPHAEKTAWTCPMHPQIEEPEPGSCPICGMDLVARGPTSPRHDGNLRDGSQPSEKTVVTIDPAVVQNMNVTTETVGRRDLVRQIRTVGHLDYDQEGMVTITTRYPGFIERIYVDALGQPIRRGQPLFEIYSPELVQTQRELLSAIRYAERLDDAPEDVRRRAVELVDAARTRLGYWDLTDEQIRSIEASGEVRRTVTVFSPSSGVVMKLLHGLEGMAVAPGMELLHVADLSKLLLTAEIFEDQLQWVQIGSQATIDITYLQGKPITGRVRYIEPEVTERTRTVNLIIEVPNPDGRLKVGMFANIRFDSVVVRDAVAIPAQSVLRTGRRDVVVTALGDGRFLPREVELGAEGDDGYVQVVDGLEDGEVVVTSAQFLIDSESNLRAAVSQMVSGSTHSGH